MKLLSFLVKNSKGILMLAVVIGIISGIGSTGLLALISFELSHPDYLQQNLFLQFIALCLIVPVSRFVSELLLIQLGQRALFNLRLRLSRQILAAPLRFTESVGAGRLLASLTDDVSAITNALTYIPMLCINLAVLAGCLAYLGWLSAGALLMVFGFMVVGIATYQLPVVRAMRSFRQAREEQDEMFGHFRALTDGAKELKLHRDRRETFLSKVLHDTAARFRRLNAAGLTIYTGATSWGNILFFIFIGLLLFVVPTVSNVTTQARIGYTIVLLYMMTPLQGILNAMPILGRANVALQKVEGLGVSLVSRASEDEAEAASEPEADWSHLELSGVCHSYQHEKDEKNFVLGPINLRFQPGELVFLVGGNGSGKTTFAKLLTGLYTPEAGEIRFDGQTIGDHNRDRYRQNFSAVFSDFFLFENLLGLESPELDAKALEYLTLLQLGHKVQINDGKLSTTALSQGQRKRLALLTAYLEDRPFYVFDEWAADQDPVFKEVFYHQLLPQLKARGKTVLVISHDDRYYYVADRIIKLDYGQVSEDTSRPRREAPEPELPEPELQGVA